MDLVGYRFKLTAPGAGFLFTIDRVTKAHVLFHADHEPPRSRRLPPADVAKRLDTGELVMLEHLSLDPVKPRIHRAARRELVPMSAPPVEEARDRRSPATAPLGLLNEAQAWLDSADGNTSGWNNQPAIPRELVRKLLAQLRAGQGGVVSPWQPIETAPVDQTLIVCAHPEHGVEIRSADTARH